MEALVKIKKPCPGREASFAHVGQDPRHSRRRLFAAPYRVSPGVQGQPIASHWLASTGLSSEDTNSKKPKSIQKPQKGPGDTKGPETQEHQKGDPKRKGRREAKTNPKAVRRVGVETRQASPWLRTYRLHTEGSHTRTHPQKRPKASEGTIRSKGHKAIEP